MFKDKKKSYRNIIMINLLSLIILVMLFSFEFMSHVNRFKEVVKSDITTYYSSFDEKLVTLSSDVLLMEDILLSSNALYEDNGEIKVNDNESVVLQNFTNWMKIRGTYDQVRVINPDGMELLRMNYNRGDITVVDESNLQDKSGRYYFDNAIDLSDNSIYMSKLDLNIENGQIELVDGEAKPMLRVASPLYSDDALLGIIIVNYLAQDLIHTPSENFESQYTFFEIINEDGYYIHSEDEGNEFAFMYGNTEAIFSNFHEYNIFDVESGEITQEIEGNELYTIYRIDENSLSSEIKQRIGQDINIVSDNGDYIIFGEVELFGTNEISSLLIRYIGLLIGVGLLSILIVKLLDELSYSRQSRLQLLEYLSSHDDLTKLPNRKHMMDAIEMKLMDSDITLLFIDLNGFKAVNDSYGHAVGDEVLIESAKRFKNCVRDTDMVSRIGGDEFLIMLPSLTENTAITRICHSIISLFEKPFIVEGVTCSVGVSIGISKGQSRSNVEEIINEADKAMYVAKEKSNSTYVFFE